MKKKILLSALTAAMLIFSGCGGGGGGGDAQNGGNGAQNGGNGAQNGGNGGDAPQARNIVVYDGFIIGATVSDDNGNEAVTNGSGVASAAFSTEGVLTAKGGCIDVNNNQNCDNGDINLSNNYTLQSHASNNVISPITDAIVNGVDEEKLAQSLGLSVEKLYDPKPFENNNTNLVKGMQVLFALNVKNELSNFATALNNEENVTAGSFYNIAKNAAQDENVENFIDTVEALELDASEIEQNISEAKSSLLSEETEPDQNPPDNNCSSETNLFPIHCYR